MTRLVTTTITVTAIDFGGDEFIALAVSDLVARLVNTEQFRMGENGCDGMQLSDDRDSSSFKLSAKVSVDQSYL
jgi:hypothetical protein